MVEDAEPDRLEGRERDRAALVLELVERHAGLEVRHLQRGAAGRRARRRGSRCCRRGRRAAASRSGPRASRPQPLGDPLALGHDRGVPVHAALRVGRRAGRVEHQPVVVAADLRPARPRRGAVDARRRRRRTAASCVPITTRHVSDAPASSSTLRVERLGDQDPHAGVADHVAQLDAP